MRINLFRDSQTRNPNHLRYPHKHCNRAESQPCSPMFRQVNTHHWLRNGENSSAAKYSANTIALKFWIPIGFVITLSIAGFAFWILRRSRLQTIKRHAATLARQRERLQATSKRSSKIPSYMSTLNLPTLCTPQKPLRIHRRPPYSFSRLKRARLSHPPPLELTTISSRPEEPSFGTPTIFGHRASWPTLYGTPPRSSSGEATSGLSLSAIFTTSEQMRMESVESFTLITAISPLTAEVDPDAPPFDPYSLYHDATEHSTPPTMPTLMNDLTQSKNFTPSWQDFILSQTDAFSVAAEGGSPSENVTAFSE